MLLLPPLLLLTILITKPLPLLLPCIPQAELVAAVNELMKTHGAAVAPGHAVISATLQEQDSSALLRMRCAVEASNALALDGTPLADGVLRLERPAEHDADAALLLGPAGPAPSVTLAAARSRCSAGAAPALAVDIAQVPAAGVRDLVPATDQCQQQQQQQQQAKQDEVFIGGLPGSWKAREVCYNNHQQHLIPTFDSKT